MGQRQSTTAQTTPLRGATDPSPCLLTSACTSHECPHPPRIAGSTRPVRPHAVAPPCTQRGVRNPHRPILCPPTQKRRTDRTTGAGARSITRERHHMKQINCTVTYAGPGVSRPHTATLDGDRLRPGREGRARPCSNDHRAASKRACSSITGSASSARATSNADSALLEPRAQLQSKRAAADAKQLRAVGGPTALARQPTLMARTVVGEHHAHAL